MRVVFCALCARHRCLISGEHRGPAFAHLTFFEEVFFVDVVVYVVANTVYYLIMVMQVMLLIRAVLSWITDEDGALSRFFYYATEPILFPIRKLLERSETIRNMPIDISYMVAMVVLVIIQFLLPTSIAI